MSTAEPSPSSSGFPWTPPNGVYATYDLHCHCGAIRYTMKLSPPLFAEQTEGRERCTAVECTCSYCERNGYIAVHPLAEHVQFTQGLEDRVSYLTGNKQNPHWFCRQCGSVLGTDLSKLMTEVLKMENRYAINIRMLQDYDPERVKVRQEKMMKDTPPKYGV